MKSLIEHISKGRANDAASFVTSSLNRKLQHALVKERFDIAGAVYGRELTEAVSEKHTSGKAEDNPLHSTITNHGFKWRSSWIAPKDEAKHTLHHEYVNRKKKEKIKVYHDPVTNTHSWEHGKMTGVGPMKFVGQTTSGWGPTALSKHLSPMTENVVESASVGNGVGSTPGLKPKHTGLQSPEGQKLRTPEQSIDQQRAHLRTQVVDQRKKSMKATEQARTSSTPAASAADAGIAKAKMNAAKTKLGLLNTKKS